MKQGIAGMIDRKNRRRFQLYKTLGIATDYTDDTEGAQLCISCPVRVIRAVPRAEPAHIPDTRYSAHVTIGKSVARAQTWCRVSRPGGGCRSVAILGELVSVPIMFVNVLNEVGTLIVVQANSPPQHPQQTRGVRRLRLTVVVANHAGALTVHDECTGRR